MKKFVKGLRLRGVTGRAIVAESGLDAVDLPIGHLHVLVQRDRCGTEFGEPDRVTMRNTVSVCTSVSVLSAV